MSTIFNTPAGNTYEVLSCTPSDPDGTTVGYDVAINGRHTALIEHITAWDMWTTTGLNGDEITVDSMEEAVDHFMALDKSYEGWNEGELLEELGGLVEDGDVSRYAGWGRDDLIDEIVACSMNRR